MEILNRESESVRINKKSTPPLVTFRHNRSAIGFNRPAIDAFGFKPGMHLHFVVDIDRIYFFMNNDQSGIPIRKEGDSFRILSKGMFTVLTKRFPERVVPGASFKIRMMVTKINDCRTYEILLGARKLNKSYKAVK